MRNYALFFAALCILHGCVPKLMIERSSYSRKQIFGRPVLVIGPVIDSILIENPNEVRNDFPGETGDPRQIINAAWYRSVDRILNRYNPIKGASMFETDSTLNMNNVSDSNAIFVDLTLGSEKIPLHFKLPSDRWLKANSKKHDIVLIVSSVSYGLNLSRFYSVGLFPSGSTVSTPTGTPHMPGSFMGGGLSTKALTGTFVYIIYDYKEKQWISYGIQNSGVKGSSSGSTRTDWENIFVKSISIMLEESPWQ